MKKVKTGLVGSGFISTVHAEALKRVPGAELFAVTSPTGTRAAEFARRHGIPHAFTDLERFLSSEVEMVVLGCPNDRRMTTHGTGRRPFLPLSTS